MGYDPKAKMIPLEEDIIMTNPTCLPLNFVVKSPMPFSVDCLEHTIPPNCSSNLKIYYDAGYQSDRKSHQSKTRIQLKYKGHNRRDKDHVNVYAESWFPNIELLDTNGKIDFGCIENHSEQKKMITMKNISKVPVKFNWAHLVDVGESDKPKYVVTKLCSKKKKTVVTDQYRIDNLLDICPISGVLEPM